MIRSITRVSCVATSMMLVLMPSACATPRPTAEAPLARQSLYEPLYASGPEEPSIPTVEVIADSTIVEEVSRWDRRIWFFTSVRDPVRTLDGLRADDIAGWGMELLDHIAKFREMATGVKGVKGIQFIGTGNEIFSGPDPSMRTDYQGKTHKSPRIFITFSGQQDNLPGAAQIQFRAQCSTSVSTVTGPQAKQPTPSTQPEGTSKQPPPPAADRELVLDLGDGVTLKLVRIPAGKFLMGSPKDEAGRDYDEGLPHGEWVRGEPRVEVTISKPFYMGVTEVTVAQYERFWKDSGREDRGLLLEKPPFKQGGDHPAVMVSWDNAQEFCEWLSKKTGRKARLPTEAQWEYACRAGTQTAFGFGDDKRSLSDYAWYEDAFVAAPMLAKTNPVARKKPNAWGLYDMHGNAWEWCMDYYAEGYTGPSRDPVGPASGGPRVMRGGSFYDSAYGCRSARREWDMPIARGSIVGFRVVLDLN